MGFVSVEASKAVDHKPGTWRLLDYGYPNGHGEQIRMLFAIAKEPFEDVRLMPAAMTDGGKALAPYKTAALGSSSPLCGTDKVPAITMPDGTHMVETASIMKFLGTLFGLNGSDLDDAKLTKMNMLAQEIVNEIQIPLGAAAVKRRIMKSGKCGFPFMLTSCFGGKKADMERVEMLPSILARAEALLVGPKVRTRCTLQETTQPHANHIVREMEFA